MYQQHTEKELRGMIRDAIQIGIQPDELYVALARVIDVRKQNIIRDAEILITAGQEKKNED